MSCSDLHRLHKPGRRDTGFSRHKGHIRAPQTADFRQGISHLSCGMVGQIADRIHRLPGGARRYQNLLPGQVFFKSNAALNIVHQHLRLRKFPGSHILAGQQPHRGLHHLIAEPLQLLQVVLHNGIFKHVGVHGRCHNLRATAGHHRGGQHIIGNSAGQFPDHIGRSRSDHHHIRLLCQRHMLHTELEIPVEGIHQTLVSCQRLKGNGVDKVGGICCHQHMHIGVKLAQHTCKAGSLVGGNASAYAQEHCFPSQHNFLLFRPYGHEGIPVGFPLFLAVWPLVRASESVMPDFPKYQILL